MPDATLEQRYGPTSGTLSGWVGVLAFAGVAALLLVNQQDLKAVGVSCCLGMGGVLVWAFVLRPRIVLHRGAEVELRNPLSTWWVPLARVEVVTVRAITRIVADGKAYDGVAVGRSVRQMIRSGRGQPEVRESRPGTLAQGGVADLMTEQILAAASLARTDGHGTGEVRRTWALVELVLLGVLALGALGCLLAA